MRRGGVRSFLQTAHLWLALVLSLPIVVIGLTGSALLLQREILVYSIPRAHAPGEQQPIPAIVEAAKSAALPGTHPVRFDLPKRPGYASAVRFSPAGENANEREVFVDPVSLQILGSQDVIERGPILALLIETHAFLQMPTHIGLPFVGFNGIIMTFMGLSGLVLWWPRKGKWKQGFLIRRGARGIAFHLDLHKVAGIWGLVVFLLVCVSGIYLTWPETIGGAIRDAFPAEEVTPVPQAGFVPRNHAIGPDEALEVAVEAIPNVRPTGIQFGGEEGPFVVDLEPQGWAPTSPLAIVLIDPKTAEVSYIEDPRAYPLRERILNLQPLFHFGTGLGWIWTVLVFLSGLLPALLATTGLTVWWKKRKARKAL